ncbi:MAG: hypothetical protein NUW37_01520 [Planctomycetes bacterium]|nr:hypothetical protein [Planctomycetota bacterium]
MILQTLSKIPGICQRLITLMFFSRAGFDEEKVTLCLSELSNSLTKEHEAIREEVDGKKSASEEQISFKGEQFSRELRFPETRKDAAGRNFLSLDTEDNYHGGQN